MALMVGHQHIRNAAASAVSSAASGLLSAVMQFSSAPDMVRVCVCLGGGGNDICTCVRVGMYSLLFGMFVLFLDVAGSSMLLECY